MWTFPRGVDHALAADVALTGFEPPDVRVAVLSGADDTLTVQVIEGIVPYDGELLLYVGAVGAFEILRRDVTMGPDGPSVALVLGRFPRS